MVFLVVWDFLATYLALALASFGTQLADAVFVSTDALFNFGISAVLNIAVLFAARLYNNLWEYASYWEMLRLVVATAIAAFLGALLHYAIGFRFPISVYFVAWVLFLFFAGAARFAFRYIHHGRQQRAQRLPLASRPRTMIVGAGETGSLTIKRMSTGDYAMQGLPVVAVDDDPAKIGTRINNVKVEGRIDDILKMVERLNIQQIVMAIPSATVAEKKHIFDICMQTPCNLLTLPNVRNLRLDELDDVRLREVELSDLLSREEIVLNTRLVSGYLAGKSVLITGGGGSIGAELARQICLVAPRQLIIFDIYENTAYELEQELKERYDDIDIRVEIGSIREPGRLKTLFECYHPQVVFHAAAHKHVPLMEANPREAICNNVFGTLNLVRVADKYGVDKFVFISTDKAVNPTSVMGATKRLGEMITQSMSDHSQTCFSTVRFGNVLGSHGSAVPVFKRQIMEGGPVTITHPDISRYFMTIPEASRLVVTAGGLAKGGEIFILSMGEPIKIDDLARKLIRLSGLEPDTDIVITYTGLRPGEKLHEELVMSEETTLPTNVADILISTSKPLSAAEVTTKIHALSQCLERTRQPADIKVCLAAQIPTYRPLEACCADTELQEML
ncbi:MAG: polysaccharide biosynthesis protein [Coriobacteriales bacterium]|jgi:FlaA1/EpsC-like NDP-sugar epimerase|nr:polysaccharide biosynthesis protein [Coriobacteriales bacterium]